MTMTRTEILKARPILEVLRSGALAELSQEYLLFFAQSAPDADKAKEAGEMADAIIKNKAKYHAVEVETNVPWWVVGLLHMRESGFSFKGHLHNGDPLTARTTHVPAGRPRDSQPPFTWSFSAIDSMRYAGFAGKSNWDLVTALYRMERYNGMGYRQKYGLPSPYLWAGCAIERPGKYIQDGKFSTSAVDAQIGVAVVLNVLLSRGHVELAKMLSF